MGSCEVVRLTNNASRKLSKVVGVKWRAIFSFNRNCGKAPVGEGDENPSNFARLVSNELRKSDEDSGMNNLGRRFRAIPKIFQSCSQFGAMSTELGATVGLINGIR